MQLTLLSPRKSLNKAYLKVKPSRSAIELFKVNLIKLLDGLDESESEEHVKNDLSDFLKNTFFQKFYINTKGRNDLVIHNGPDAKSCAGVLIEAKKLSNKFEMIRQDNLNAKAFHELILYYLRERITNHNLEIKHLVATNIYEWYIFDAGLFEKLFAQNKPLIKQFTDFEEGRLSGNTTDFFYKQIAEPFLATLTCEICFTTFDFREYDKPLRNDDKKDDSKLIALYKLLSPEHLLKLPFTNDSNSLDKAFYTELLHIIGLTETKEGSKKLIGRKKEGQRDPGSLIENAIIQTDSLDMINRLNKPSRFGETLQERLFNVSLELAITWINRILFMKLLEAQLINYHKSDPSYVFLTSEKINGYDSLNSLFFRVLARKNTERDAAVAKLFEKVPYLNSSLFEPTELERDTIFISNLQDDCLIPILPGTVLKNNTGKRLTGNMNGLDYLFAFLDAYDFSGEGAEEIQEDNKTLINASVLGLIFEKINGYKDGSFFTPGFITMYMCHETIRRAVVQKFNDAKGWDCKDIDQVYDKIEDRNEANTIINSLKICDPAVGSGHFLVSALNEIIALKSDLNILQDREGRRLKEYRVEVVNDELIVTDEDGELFVYNPTNKESQRIQQTLFHEKQTIIENCLFGVDINPNSVKICRLRLWIELLKNSYYKTGSNFTELETLPNIDINIKCGNSLISRYALDADIKQALKKSKWSIASYRVAVMSYRNATNKEEKRTMERLIESIKTDFETEVAANDKRLVQLRKLNSDLFNITRQTSLFDLAKKEKDEWNKKVKDLTAKIQKFETELEEIKSNKIFENAFEWRFEFPEVLNDEGDFVGFDVVIGNPPYGVNFNKISGHHYENLYSTFNWRGESYIMFIERAQNLLRINGQFGYIIPDTILNLGFTEAIRMYLLQNTTIREIDLLPSFVFPDATVDTILLFFEKAISEIGSGLIEVLIKIFKNLGKIEGLDNPERLFHIDSKLWQNLRSFNIQSDNKELKLIQRIDADFLLLGEYCDLFSGIKAYEVGKGNPPQTQDILNSKPFTSKIRTSESWLPLFDGKNIGFYELLWHEDNWINYGEWLAAPREKQNFESEKILIRKITNSRLIAHYIPYTSYCNTLLFVLKLKPGVARITYKALLGILNSGLMGWYFRKKFQINKEDTFPQIMIRDILQFALPNVSDEITKRIEQIVDQIITLKQKSPPCSSTGLESEIDRLVYKLYGLTEEEIKIVEGN
jgi:hypothetical protein